MSLLALTRDTGKIVLAVCQKADLTSKEMAWSGSTGASETISPMTSLGLLLYHRELGFEVTEK